MTKLRVGIDLGGVSRRSEGLIGLKIPYVKLQKNQILLKAQSNYK